MPVNTMGIEVSPRVKLSYPKPDYCSMCARGADAELVLYDCQAAFDAGSFVTQEGQWIAGSDDLHICHACVKELCEVAGLRPETNRKQLNEIRRLELQVERKDAYILKLEAALSDRPELEPKHR